MAIAFMVGLGAGIYGPGIHWTLWLAASLIGLWIAIAAAAKRPAILLPPLFCVALGYLSIQPWLGIDLPDNHVSRHADQGLWQIQGTVQSTVVLKPHRWEFLLDAAMLSRKTDRTPVCGLIKVSGRGRPPGIIFGDVVVFEGRLRTLRNFANPGAFDYKRYMALRKVHARVYVRKDSLRCIAPATKTHWRVSLDAMREKLSQRMESALAGKSIESIAVLQALTVGDRRHMSDAQRQAYRRTGVGHILAISGLHIGFVAAVAFAVGKWLLGWVPLMLRLAWTRKGAAILSLSVVIAYGFLAGLSPSTQRAMIMVAVFLAGFWIGRRHDWLNALALAAMVVLIVHPPALLSVSFQLSFSAILAIIAGMRVIKSRVPPPGASLWVRMAYRLLSFLWVSILAIGGTLPLVVYYFNEASLVGLLTNLIVVPLVSLVVVPAGLAGLLAMSISSDLATWCWQVATGGITAVEWVVRHVADWPWAAVRCVTPSILEICLYYCLAGVGLYWPRIPKRPIVMGFLLLLAGLDIGYWTYARFGGRTLQVTAVDVGQGSATLLQLPGGHTVLVDGGGFSDNRMFDVGQRILAPFLWRQKIRTIDLVILTHPNSDHLNGLLYLLQHFHIKAVWSNQESADTQGYAKWRQLLARRHIPQSDFATMPEVFEINGVRFDILAPPRDFLQRRQSDKWRDSNNNSMVVRVTYGKISFLLAGDIAGPAESELVQRHGESRLASTILMVPHHGSRKSSSMHFLTAVNPKEAVVSAGWQNRFGFPHDEVVDRLTATGSQIWSTSEHGAVQLITDGKTYNMRTTRKEF